MHPWRARRSERLVGSRLRPQARREGKLLQDLASSRRRTSNSPMRGSFSLHRSTKHSPDDTNHTLSLVILQISLPISLAHPISTMSLRPRPAIAYHPSPMCSLEKGLVHTAMAVDLFSRLDRLRTRPIQTLGRLFPLPDTMQIKLLNLLVHESTAQQKKHKSS